MNIRPMGDFANASVFIAGLPASPDQLLANDSCWAY
jgi:hypothetical protein